MQTFDIEIQGMSCDHCVRAVKNAVEDVDGVERAEVRIGHADVTARDGVDRKAIEAAIVEEGYEVR